MTLRKRTLIALASLALAGGVVHWIAASTGCSVRNPNSCDYNERYERVWEINGVTGLAWQA
jgi:hypothetical protein